MDLAAALVWTLRILLPIILFCIYFKFQAPKDELSAGPSGNVYSRQQLLDTRSTVRRDYMPDGLADITLKDQTQAPALFVHNTRGGGGERASGGGAGGAGGRGPGGGAGGGGGRREGERGGQRGERRERRKDSGFTGESKKEASQDKVSTEQKAAQDKMHLEALLNFVAFNQGQQQRFFLPDEATPPPPPKKKAPRAQQPLAPLIGSSVESGILISSSTAVHGEPAEKANSEAQMVLTGAIRFRHSEVAKRLYTQLSDSQVEITEKTFALMIEASVLARDLKSASDFLMKMESSGYCPDSDLLDKVMDLYSLQKSQKETDRNRQAVSQKQQQQQNEQLHAVEKPFEGDAYIVDESAQSPMEFVEAMLGQHYSNLEDPHNRSKLSSGARVFVPSFGIPPPPPKPPAMQSPTEGGQPQEGGAEASAAAAAAAAAAAGSAPAPEAAPSAGLTAGGGVTSWADEEDEEDLTPVVMAHKEVAAQAAEDENAAAPRTRLTAAAQPFQPGVAAPFHPGAAQPFQPGAAQPFQPGAAQPFQPGAPVFQPSFGIMYDVPSPYAYQTGPPGTWAPTGGAMIVEGADMGGCSGKQSDGHRGGGKRKGQAKPQESKEAKDHSATSEKSASRWKVKAQH